MPLTSDALAPGDARRAVEAQFATHPRAAELLLCVSEVVTNAVRHASPPHSLRLSQAGDTLRVEVADSERQAPVLNRARSALDVRSRAPHPRPARHPVGERTDGGWQGGVVRVRALSSVRGSLEAHHDRL